MLDLAITGGLVVDGTGAPPQRADVGVRDGRVVAIGALDESARATRDADGLVVAPGFVDIHTHQDAQVFWDPACTPSPQFGCTSVIAGNCGFSIAPIDGADADFMMRMLARVEGIPLATLEAGVPWSWNSFAQYLDAVEAARPAINMGVMVGHSAVRRSVLGADGDRAATADEIAAMQSIVDAAVAAGGMGFSSSWAPTHVDGSGEPVPSRFATSEEVIALAEVVGRYPGTQLEFIPTTQVFEAVHIDTMIGMSRAAGRPVNWNVLIPRSVGREATEAKLAVSDTAVERGARVLALSYPDVIRARATFRGTLYDGFPGWARTMTLPDDEKLVALQDPDTRARLYAASQSEEAGLMRATLGDWGGVTLADTKTDRYQQYVGKSFAEIAAALGTTPFEALLDLVVEDRLATSIIPVPPGDDPESWAFRERTWHDRRIVLGASDAGAHVDMIWTYDWACAFLSRVRERAAMPIEAAVRRVSGELAELYGLIDRGVVGVGAHADLVLFDADEIGPGLPEWRDDLPGGAGRLTGAATGIESVFVNGTEIVHRGDLTGAQPGTLLRSGIDTA